MTCRECGTKLRVWKSRPKEMEVEEREYRCPTCRRRIVTTETVSMRLGPVRITPARIHWNHDASKPLGRRSRGTLAVTSDTAGMRYEITTSK